MCTIAAALGIGQFVVGAMGAVAQHNQEVKQANAINQFYMQNAEAANAAARSAYANQSHAIEQHLAAADQDVLERRIQALKARGTARNAAGEAGVTGLSVDALYADYAAAEGRGVDSVRQNFEIERDNILAQMEATHHQTVARINSAPRAQPPSMLPVFVRIAGAALGGFSTGSGRSVGYAPTTNYALGIPG